MKTTHSLQADLKISPIFKLLRYILMLLIFAYSENIVAMNGTFTKITTTAELTTGYYVIVASENATSNASKAMGPRSIDAGDHPNAV